MEVITLTHLLQHPLRVCLFTNVTNAPYLRQQLLDGNTDFEAINDLLNGRLKSRNVHSEIVFSLSPNNNIADSFRRFGIADTSTSILAIKVGGDASLIAAHLRKHVEGNPVGFTDEALGKLCDPGRIRKIYRVDMTHKSDAEAFVIGSMALKGS